MSEFVKLVQKGQIPNPTQKKFSLEKWNKGFENIDNPKDQDTKLYKSGIWFFNRFESIRALYSNYDISSIDKTFLLKSICSDIHRDSILATERLNNHFEGKEGFVANSIPSIDIGSSINSMDIDSLLENIIDGARLPINDIQQKDDNGTNRDFDKVFNFVVDSKNIGIYYDSLVHYWKECQWNGWHVFENENMNLIVRPKNKLEGARSISEHREFALATEVAGLAVKNWDKLRKRDRLEILKSTQIVSSIDETGNIKLSDPVLNIDKSPHSWPLRLMAEEIYWNEILVTDLPEFPGVNLRDLLTLWDILSSLGHYIMRNLNNISSEVYNEEDLTKYCYSIPRNSLTNLVKQGLNITDELAQKISQKLIFDKNLRSELWHRPFVDLKNGELAPIYPALCFPNMIRFIENWMKKGGLKLTKRGDLFEEYVKLSLSDACEEFIFGKDKVRVLDSSEITDAKNEKEQIDLILVLDDTILLGEAKCHLYPTDPLEVHNMVNDIKYGVTQIRRKERYFRKNITNLVSDLKLNKTRDYKIISCIVTNRALCTGFNYKGIPIIDIKILEKYFNTDHLPLFYDIQSDSYKNKIDFYSTLSEAKNNIKSYLFLPPQIQTYLLNLKRDYITMPSLPEDSKPHIFANLKVDFSDIDWTNFM